MEMISVYSSNVLAIGYDYDSAILRIQFKKSGIYDYYNVPQHLFEALLGADSKGNFINNYIVKGGFAYAKN